MGRLYELLRVNQLRDLASVIDILLLWFVFYQAFLLIRRTRAVQMAYGLIAVVALWLLTSPGGVLPLRSVHFLIGTLLPYGVFAIIVIFQTPIRQALAWFGRVPFPRFRQVDNSGKLVEEIALAATAMGSRRIGALILLERDQGLRNYIETGIAIDAIVSYDLLLNIFSPKTPLHDGAVIVSDGRIKGASCFLPLSTDPYISRAYGTRHRAAIGVTEETDAIAIVVSEERGVVSAAIEGQFRADLDTRALRAFLEEHWIGSRPVPLTARALRVFRRHSDKSESTATGIAS